MIATKPKIALIAPQVMGPRNQVRKAQPPLGIAYLAAILEKNGYKDKVMCLDAVVEGYDEMVLVKDIEYFSLCEHHLLPFFGHAHVAYIPDGKIIGLSKIPRIVDLFSRRLQVQERLTSQVAETLNDVWKPKGVAVVLEGQHMCMQMRGVENKNSYASSSSMLGIFREDSKTRKEFLNLISMEKRF